MSTKKDLTQSLLDVQDATDYQRVLFQIGLKLIGKKMSSKESSDIAITLTTLYDVMEDLKPTEEQ